MDLVGENATRSSDDSPRGQDEFSSHRIEHTRSISRTGGDRIDRAHVWTDLVNNETSLKPGWNYFSPGRINYGQAARSNRAGDPRMTRLWIVRAGKQGERELAAIEQAFGSRNNSRLHSVPTICQLVWTVPEGAEGWDA